MEQQSITNYQNEAATQERERVRNQRPRPQPLVGPERASTPLLLFCRPWRAKGLELSASRRRPMCLPALWCRPSAAAAACSRQLLNSKKDEYKEALTSRDQVRNGPVTARPFPARDSATSWDPGLYHDRP